MVIKRVLYCIGSAIIAIGLLAILLSSMSSAIAAPTSFPQKVNQPDIPSNDRWRILQDMQTGRGDPGVIALNNKIHVVSGYFSPGFGYSSSQEVYDPQTNTWQYIWGFPHPRSDMAVVNAGDKIFAIGGWNVNEGGVQGYNHMYDPGLGSWITRTAIITPVSGAGGVVISDSIYVIGGYNGISDTKHVQIYNTISDTWSIGIPMSSTRSALEAVSLDGLIYVIGGTFEPNDVEIFDPSGGTWQTGVPLPDTRFSMAVVSRQGKIYVVGGTDVWGSGIYTDTNFVFDPGSGTWSTADPVPTARGALGAAVISDTIYVIGGVGAPGAPTSNEAYADFPLSPTFTSIVSDDPDPSQVLQPLVVSYAVTSQLDIPTGVVTVTTNLNTLQCSQLLISGMGSCQFSLDTPGVYTITAAYGGDSFHTASSANESHLVVKAATTTTLTSDEPDPSLNAKPITVNFEVTSLYGMPTGSVTVTVSNSPQSCSDTLSNGMGSCGLFFDTPGTYTLTATYSGDDLHSISSDIEGHLVILADTTTTLTGTTPDPSLVGQPVSITFGVASPYGTPPGMVTVTVSNSPETCSTALAAGQGSCEITLDAEGTYTITAAYGGNITFAPSSDSSLHTVVKFLDLFIPIILRGQ